MKYNMLSISLIVLGLLAAPARGQYRCFFGNLHAHTSYSDGVSIPDTAFAYARDVAGIDVQGLTEHNNGGAGYTITPDHYQRLRHVADSMTVPGDFVALAGQEIGSMGYGGFGHISVFEAPNLSPYFNAYGELLNCYSWIGAQSLPAQLNHPGAGGNNNFNDLFFYQDYDQAIDLIEVLNSDYENERYYLQALANGWHVGATGNQDNHGHNWGNEVNHTTHIIPLTGIWADTLTKDAVLQALQSHRTTAVEVSPANDRIQLSLVIDGAWQGSVGLKYQGQASFTVNAFAPVSNFRKLYLYNNGVLVDSLAASSRSVEWTFTRQLDLGAQHFFAKAVQADTDRAWTSPVFFDVVARNSVTANSRNKVSTWPTPVRDQAKIIYLPIDGATSVKAKIFDLAGNIVWEESNSQPGQPVFWNAVDTNGNPAPNGIYIILLEQTSPSETRVYTGKTMVSR